jgi:phage terminase small subunit
VLGFTGKQEAFITEYLRDFNATQAAIRAGYSEKTAYAIGHENLKKPEIAAEIQRRIAEKAMGADEVLLRLADHARGDMGDFLDITPMGFVIDVNKAQQAGKTHLIKKVKLRTQTSVSKEGIETETHDMEIELYNAQDALVQLGRFHKLFTDKTEIKSDINLTVNWDEPNT